MNLNLPNARPAPPAVARRPGIAPAALLLVLAGLVAYAATFSVPFLYDDEGAVVRNESLRHWWPLSQVLFPPQADAYAAGLTTAGRPVLNLSLASNYAISGDAVWSYHAFNLLVHLAAALVLFGLVRRTLLQPGWAARRDDRTATTMAWAGAALWLLHPLQTEAVTYVSQRAESLMGLFFLLTLYAFARGVQAEKPGRWFLLCTTGCLLGMATKEVMVGAPLLVLLYDRTFVAGSFGSALRKRGSLYLALAATWMLLGALVMSTGGNRGGTAGFGVGVSPWAYWATQFQAITRYLALSFWPRPLVFEYGAFWTKGVGDVLPYAAVVLPLIAGAIVALWRWPAVGFVGAWFFVILAPTSLTPGTQQMIVEHRMYLPLAAVVVLAVLGVERGMGRRGLWLFFPVAAVCLFLTRQRNADYRTETVLWADTVAKRPANARAHYNLGHAFSESGRMAEAAREYAAALKLRPGYAEAHNNLGNALSLLGRLAEAIPHYEEALRLQPAYANAHYNLGCALVEAGRVPEAIEHLATSARLQPAVAEVRYNLAGALARAGRDADALAAYSAALELRPDYPEALNDRANLLGRLGREADAFVDYEAALRLAPAYADAHVNFANALVRSGRAVEALAHYATALRLRPDSAVAHYNFGNALLGLGRLDEAVAHYREATRLAPDLAGAHHNLALALVRLGRPGDALAAYERTLQLAPGSAVARHNFSLALAQLGREDDAIAQDEIALRLQPDFPAARDHLAFLRRRLHPGPAGAQ